MNKTTQYRYVVVACLVFWTAGAGFAQVSSVNGPEIIGQNAFYTSNRAPLVESPFIKLPIGSIIPRGWLRTMLELERDGMTGHLEEISPWLKFQTSAWASKEGIGERGWEELPYWLKGFGDLGYVLKDQATITAARKWIEPVLSSQRADGWFGPRDLLTSLKSKASPEGVPDLWPIMIMLNVLQSYYEYSKDERVISLLTNYFKWENSLPATAFGAGYWPRVRAGDNIESVYWLYNRTGEPWLLELAGKIHGNMARWDTGVINWHNVNFAQGFREPAVFWMAARQPELLAAPERNYQQAMNLYGQFAGGTFVSDEDSRPGYADPQGGFETCGIVEFMHSFEMLTKISGNPLWADRAEEIAFNSFPAAETPDLKALHYLTCPNQVQLDRSSKAPAVENSGATFSYSPFEVYRCCQHNVSHGWPYYAEELWLATPDNGLAASLYAASELNARVGNGTQVKISEETEYPFQDTIRLKLDLPSATAFPLYLRVPRWCDNISLQIDGRPVVVKSTPLSYIRISRQWANGDTVTLHLPMKISVRKWSANKDSVSVDYGPLSFALKIEEKWQKFGNQEKWPEWEVMPGSAWNYGLILDPQDPAGSFRIERKPGPPATQPFTPEKAPLALLVKARKIPDWRLDPKTNIVGLLPQSPVRSSEPVEEVTLIPMGAARLRISSFPIIGDAPAVAPRRQKH